VQSVVKLVVPYAKPSVQLVDKIVDTALGLASKPLELVQSTVSSISGRVVDYKAVVSTKVSNCYGIASDKLSECKTSATKALQKCKSLVVEKRSAVLQVLQQYKVLATEKLGHVSSVASTQLQQLAVRLHLIELKDMATTKFKQVSTWTRTKLQALAARVHLFELRDMACRKGNAWKESVIELRDMGCRKGGAAKKHVIAVAETVPGKAYSSAARVLGQDKIDFVLQMADKYVPLMKETNDAVGSKAELDKKSQ